jgi:tRNA A-37 threonylcarbamoyl transferase component Bud32
MGNARYLRDARHVDKVLYLLVDDLFYEPLESHYRPLDEYVRVVTDLLRALNKDWATTRDGFWYHIHPRQVALPVQGWKVHVSATKQNAAAILERAARIALANNVSFKFALDRKVLFMMSSKRWPRGGSGKFITMYPPSQSSFKSLIEQLYAVLQAEEGPYILSDKRYKDCRVLYYRFGGMAPNGRMDITGEKVPVLVSPAGEVIPDIRTPYFSPPHWTTDPFPDEAPELQELTVHGGRYLVKQALAFSNTGGVYLAQDCNTGLEVVIKEARAHTGVDETGQDAIQRLKKEYEILELLSHEDIVPKPIELFHEWEHHFLVEEYVEGVGVRETILNQSPFLRRSPSLDDACRYYEIFRNISTKLTHAIDLLHRRGIVFGDLSPNNIKIDLSSYALRLIDLEVAIRLGMDEPTQLYTPGFKRKASTRNPKAGVEDDFYAVAAVMLYMLFPISPLAALRDDLFGSVLETMLANIGWAETPVLKAIHGLAKNEITCARACELLDEPARIAPPSYADDVEPRDCDPIVQELGRFIVANIRTESKDSLFPADPFLHRTNPLSLGFGACGVLYALKKCNCEIPQAAWEWLERKLERVKAEELAPGLLTGAAGIAWSLEEMGWGKRAAGFLKMANESPLLRGHPSYLYGMAGVGMANLHFYLRSRRPEYLAIANELGDELLRRAQESERGIYWEHEKVIHVGYGYGQSGVALFFLRLYQVTGREKFLAEGRRALEFDLSHGLSIEPGIISFPRAPGDPTLLPYLEEGSAGIAKVAIRYGMWNQLEAIWADVHRKYSGFVGLLYGLGSFVDVLTDAFLLSNDVRFLEMAKRPVTGIRDIYLLKRPEGLATPGDNLFRISCDYTTGIAGVMRALHRFAHHDEADFVLDEVFAAGKEWEKDQNTQVCTASSVLHS